MDSKNTENTNLKISSDYVADSNHSFRTKSCILHTGG